MTELALASDPVALANAHDDPARFVIAACEQARGWLCNALAFDDVREVMNLRAQAEAVAVYTREKRLGLEADLAAKEIVRRAERGVARCTRDGVEKGLVKGLGSNQHAGSSAAEDPHAARATDLMGPYGSRYNDTRRLGEIPDDEFERVVEDAKAAGEMTRKGLLDRAKRGTPPAPTPAPPLEKPLNVHVGPPTCAGPQLREHVVQNMARLERELLALASDELSQNESNLLARALERVLTALKENET